MSLNRILTNEDRKHFEPLIKDMSETCPEMMSRKIGAANVQQSFALDHVLTLLESPPFDGYGTICCAGSFEDTAGEFLRVMNYDITMVDPAINSDLHTIRTSTDKKFDMVLSVSVLEHVQNDEEFIEDICVLLNPGGTAVLTCDFNDAYKPGDPLPATDVRFFTKHDLSERLVKVLESNGCALADTPDWNAPPDFIYQGHLYSFATFVFTKS